MSVFDPKASRTPQTEAKLLIFSLYAVNATFYAFLPLVAEDKGFTPWQLGALLTSSKLVMMVASPIWTIVADYTHTHALMLALLALGACVAMFGFALTSNFTGACVLLAFFGCFSGPKNAICDSLTLTKLSAAADGGGGIELYGAQRLWGSIAWGSMAFVVGMTVEHGSYHRVPLIHCFCLLVFAWVLFVFFRGTRVFTSSAVQPSHTLWQGLTAYFDQYAQVAYRRRVIWPLIAIGVLGAGENMMVNFILQHIRAQGAPPMAVSSFILIDVTSEALVFGHGDYLLRRYGVANLFYTASACFAFKGFWYAVAPTWWVVLLVESLHGLCFASVWIAAVHHLALCTTRASTAIGMSLLWLAYGGSAHVVGGVSSGLIVQAYGTTTLFLFSCVVCGVAGYIFFLCSRWDYFTAAQSALPSPVGSHFDEGDVDTANLMKLGEDPLPGPPAAAAFQHEHVSHRGSKDHAVHKPPAQATAVPTASTTVDVTPEVYANEGPAGIDEDVTLSPPKQNDSGASALAPPASPGGSVGENHHESYFD